MPGCLSDQGENQNTGSPSESGASGAGFRQIAPDVEIKGSPPLYEERQQVAQIDTETPELEIYEMIKAETEKDVPTPVQIVDGEFVARIDGEEYSMHDLVVYDKPRGVIDIEGGSNYVQVPFYPEKPRNVLSGETDFYGEIFLGFEPYEYKGSRHDNTVNAPYQLVLGVSGPDSPSTRVIIDEDLKEDFEFVGTTSEYKEEYNR